VGLRKPGKMEHQISNLDVKEGKGFLQEIANRAVKVFAVYNYNHRLIRSEPAIVD
jgi:hypothetical protein